MIYFNCRICILKRFNESHLRRQLGCFGTHSQCRKQRCWIHCTSGICDMIFLHTLDWSNGSTCLNELAILVILISGFIHIHHLILNIVLIQMCHATRTREIGNIICSIYQCFLWIQLSQYIQETCL